MIKLTSGIIDKDFCYHNGYHKGQKDLAEKLKSEIKSMEYHMIDCEVLVSQEEVLNIIEKCKGVSE